MRARLAIDPEVTVRHAALANPQCPSAAVHLAARMAIDATREVAVRSPLLPGRVARRHLDSSDLQERCAAASNPNLSVAGFRQIHTVYSNEMMLVAAASNPRCPPQMLAELATADLDHPSGAPASLRSAAARHPNCPPATLAALSRDPNKHVRVAVAGNPNCPEELLVALSRDEYEHAREASARHRKCPQEALARLAADDEPVVRRTVAANRSAAPELLARLAAGPRGQREVALRNPECPDHVLAAAAGSRHEYVRVSVARNPATRPEILARMLTAPDGAGLGAERGIAANAHTPPRLLTQLAASSDLRTVANVARNPATSSELRQRLALHSAPRVRAAAALNPDCDMATVLRLAGDEAPEVRASAARWRTRLD